MPTIEERVALLEQHFGISYEKTHPDGQVEGEVVKPESPKPPSEGVAAAEAKIKKEGK